MPRHPGRSTGIAKALIAGAAILVVSQSSQAQQWTNADIGVTAGYSNSSVSGDDVQNGGSISGFVLGVSAIRRINPMWSFQPELLYSRRGASARDDDGTFDVKGTADYIDLPLLLKLSIGDAIGGAVSGMRPSVHFGPYVGMNLSCNFSGEIGGDAIDDDCETFEAAPNADQNPFLVKTQSIDYGVIAGAGLDFGNIGVFARYQMGMAEISDGFDLKHRVISIGGRWSFRPMR